ncbi:ATP-binding protein [Infirmifilum lucidum]|uniref:ATP-binding protein n=1 Tax=Infirmifilum lucidum TaxID=2776706 RepID=A0A7L9FJB8_9CREN|nr:ATP-binding protein [Infirmifilum lucidum]QOJ78986.1 ATP-binding protein [Infirmifilum lucidum]
MVVIDEFPYLVELDPGVVSLLQKVWDMYLSRRPDVVLILCGSSVGMMETEILSYRSPLYGRRTGQWRVDELEIPYLRAFVPGYASQDVLRVYGALGGVPAYLRHLDPSLGFLENVERLFFRRGAVLYEEAENLLRQELREPRNYKLVLEAVAGGRRRVSEVAAAMGLDKTTVSKYLDTLELLGVVGHEAPVLETPKTKKRLYYIKDNYFNFWFRYVHPNRDLVEADRGGRGSRGSLQGL